MLSLQGSAQLTHSAGRLFEHFLDLQVFGPHVTLVLVLVLVLVVVDSNNGRHASNSDRT